MKFRRQLILIVCVTVSSFIFCNSIFGQEANLVSKNMDWKEMKPEDSNSELEKYFKFDKEYYNWSFSDQKAYLKKGLKAAQILENKSITHEFEYRLGNLYLAEDSLFLALGHFTSALNIASNAKMEADALNILGFTYSELEDYETALEYYFQAVEAIKTIQPEQIASYFINISIAYKNLEDYDNAIKYNWYANAAAKQRTFPNKEYIHLFNYAFLAENHVIHNQLDSSEYYIELALETLKLVDTVQYFFIEEAKKMTLVRAIETYLHLNKLDIADKYLQEIKNYKLTYHKSTVRILEAEYEIKQKRFSKALSLLDKLKQDKVHLNLKDQQEIMTLKIDCYKALGNASMVIESYEKLLTLIKKKEKKDRIRAGTLANIKYETLKKNEQIKSLQLNQKISIAIIISAIIILLLVSGWSYYVYKNNQERKAQNQLLLENQQTIEKQASKLQVLYDYKNKLFANIAHELRTPLMLIANPIKAILKTNNISEQDTEKLQIADRNIRSLSSTIYQILDLAKRENVELTTQPVQFDVNELIQFIANDFRSMAQFKSIQFSKPTIGLKTPVITDGEKLMIVIRNLLSNAFKFTPQNGQVSINLIDLGEEITVNIQDTGKGISKEDLAKIFDRHFQVDPANLPNEGGMGIGLSICKEYITLLKGSIIAESELGKGSSFTIRFPKQLVNTTEINAEASTTFNALIAQSPTLDLSINQEKTLKVENIDTDEITKILVVEDNIDMSNYLQNILSETYEISFAQDGQQALEVLQNNRPDLIISDYMMPNMNGMELIEQLKSNPNYAGIPVIMLTAQQAIDVKLSALRIGVDDYLTKPFDNRELLARISNILTNQRIIKTERQSKIDKNGTIENTPPIMNMEDLAWLEELENKSKQHIANPDFTIRQLAIEMAISYSNIFKKIKKMTGLTANEYLREIRFQEALKLLEAKRYGSVKAVSLSVGYKNTKYFSKNFKNRFGKNPSEYLD